MPDPVTQLTEVVVDARRITFSYIVPPWMDSEGGGPLPGSDEEVDPGSTKIECVPVAGMSDEAKLQALLIFAMAAGGWR
ncbi:hypothetical protein [Brevundimonas sp.]|uniref:hypothetical protein n=1 Tax=Brevundimonas sp. TaxID=1871086 RepID=UPI002BE13254|nr:hypothetical protein [Brevundimonas sp.]HWQ87535.1 hypothetical protein [Brevundimonas sp.]